MMRNLCHHFLFYFLNIYLANHIISLYKMNILFLKFFQNGILQAFSSNFKFLNLSYNLLYYT